MPIEITMPQLSDTMTEGTVVKWLKKEGDKVNAGEIIAEVETDKATMEMEAFEGGTLAKLVIPEGGKVPVGAAIAVLAKGKETVDEVKRHYAAASNGSSAAPAPAEAPAKITPPVAKPVAAQAAGASATPTAGVGSGTATLEKPPERNMREPDNAIGHGATREPPTAVPPLPHNHGNGHNRLKATPLARRIAADRGIDLHALQGSGPGGRIIQRDVESYTPAPAPAAAPTSAVAAPPALPPLKPGSGEKQVITLSKMRQAIAKNLLASKQNIPHFYETIDVDVEELTLLRERINKNLADQKVRLSLGDFIAKAVVTALQRHPTVNSTFNGTEITRYADVHLGMAVSIPDGLIVPVLRNIQTMGLKEIRTRSADLVERARAQRLKQEEMTGGTFTVSNLGTYGIREFSAIINPPQVAILAIASAEKRPVVCGDSIVARTMMTLTLSADHRVVDGALAAEFLRTLKSLLEEPAMMMV